eukprot:TRINITY_DN5443_c0_g4_i1.p1 TRINITY_DN5443_c0_g4~~TRINITY_DN5443_c0_g4_i1.p1  ORF type:complete len:415 (-),score=71.94 TRINITY_DN5443_c0_g4_i1:90-1334(-)
MTSNMQTVTTADMPVEGQKFGLGLSWDAMGRNNVDVDLQAVAFAKSGKLLDAVYYNNLKALGRGLTHSGDETSGEKGGFDELVWANLAGLSDDVGIIAFVVACYSGGHLQDVPNGVFHAVVNTKDNVVGQFRLEKSVEEVDLVAALIRQGNSWVFRLVDEPAQDGQHFVDILEPTLGNFVRSVIPGAPRRLKAAFAMDKGTVVDLPKSSVLKSINCALGWNTDKGSVDLDVSAVLLDGNGDICEAIFFGKQRGKGITHSGDNRTGAGSGDDEVINVELEILEPRIQQIVFVVNIYSQGTTFARVSNPYCRVVSTDREQSEFCRYELSEAGNKQGLVIARLFREPGNVRWGFQAVGTPCAGNTWKASESAIVRCARQSAKSLQMGHSGSMSTPNPLDRQASVVQQPCSGSNCVLM